MRCVVLSCLVSSRNCLALLCLVLSCIGSSCSDFLSCSCLLLLCHYNHEIRCSLRIGSTLLCLGLEEMPMEFGIDCRSFQVLVWSCSVLLPRLVLSCLVLSPLLFLFSCPVLTCLVLSYLAFYCTALNRPEVWACCVFLCPSPFLVLVLSLPLPLSLVCLV